MLRRRRCGRLQLERGHSSENSRGEETVRRHKASQLFARSFGDLRQVSSGGAQAPDPGNHGCIHRLRVLHGRHVTCASMMVTVAPGTRLAI